MYKIYKIGGFLNMNLPKEVKEMLKLGFIARLEVLDSQESVNYNNYCCGRMGIRVYDYKHNQYKIEVAKLLNEAKSVGFDFTSKSFNN